VSQPAHSEALGLVAAMVLENGARWGEVATEDQWADVRSILDPAAPPFHYLTRSRGYSKTSDLAAVTIAMLLKVLPAGSFLYGLAADRDQGRLVADVIRGLAARTPGLSGLTIDTYKVMSANGSVFEVLAADAASSWGIRPSFVIVDELSAWASTSGPQVLWESVTSAMAKIANSRMVVLTSAGSPEHFSHKLLEHAYSDSLWRVHEIPGPPPWADRARLAEQKRRLPESSYARLFENKWTASEDKLTSLDDLRACITLDGPQLPVEGRSYTIGVDLGVKKDRSVAAVCHGERKEGDVTVVLDRIEVWAGSRLRPVNLGVVEEWLRETSRLYNGAQLVADPWQGIGLYQRLRAAGVRVKEFSFNQSSVGKLAVTLHTAIRDRHLALPPDEALIDELASIQLRETSPGVYRLDHAASGHDDMGVAIGLAAQRILETPPPRRGAKMKYYGPPSWQSNRPSASGWGNTGRVSW
jgi:phage terminase large subunit-like protein